MIDLGTGPSTTPMGNRKAQLCRGRSPAMGIEEHIWLGQEAVAN